MSVTLSPTTFIWGIPKEFPKLPEGFKFVQNERSFLMAVSPQGQSFYVSTEGLYHAIPTMELHWTGKFCVGEKYEPKP